MFVVMSGHSDDCECLKLPVRRKSEKDVQMSFVVLLFPVKKQSLLLKIVYV